MIFDTSIRRELARSFGATFVVLLTIVMTMMLIRTLGHAAKGSVNPTEVNMVITYSMLGHMPTLLTMSLFIATVGTLSRLYMESEMVIWQASGKSLKSILRPVFRFVWPFLLLISVGVLVIWPWSTGQIFDMRERFERRGDLERVTPGQFQESADGSRVFFIDKTSATDHQGKNIFIASTDRNRHAMTTSQYGHTEEIDDQRYLMLQSGQRIEQVNGKTDIRVSDFAVYGTRMGQDAKTPAEIVIATIPTWELIQDPTPPHLGELSWRLGICLAAFNLVLLSVAITSANPRVGRSGNFAFAFFVFVLYYNFINLGNTWIGIGRSDIVGYMLKLHGSFFLCGLIWLLARDNNWSPRLLWRRSAKVAS